MFDYDEFVKWASVKIRDRPLYRIYVHPDNIDRLRAMIGDMVPCEDEERPRWEFGMLWHAFMGTEIVANPHIPRFRRRWVPPSGRFWEMEASDEPWAAKLGFGHYEDTDEPVIYQIDLRKAYEMFDPRKTLRSLFM